MGTSPEPLPFALAEDGRQVEQFKRSAHSIVLVASATANAAGCLVSGM